MTLLSEGQKVLIIRYGKKKDCIEKHEEVIDALGYCWFGKIGVVPSAKAVAEVQAEDNPCIVLYSQGKGYVASFEQIVFEKPKEGYPIYYQEELFDNNVFPKSYFKLTSMQLLESAEMEN